jgi:hypothetical protein|tara:strand:- start:520 stop:789 length:270 start_codon:yes stop_codon:yes gene_type:complete
MSTVLKETEDYIIVVPENYNNNLSLLFCSVCDYILKSHEDTMSNERYSCCHDCFLRYVEARKDEWANGWRPKKEDIESIRIEKGRIFIK